MRLDLSDPVCSKSPVNIYNRVGTIFTSPSGKSTNSSSSSSSKSAASPGVCKNSVVGNSKQQQALFRSSSDSVCDSKSQLFYLENYANQHLADGEGGLLKQTGQGKSTLLLGGDEYVATKENLQQHHDSDSEVSSGEGEENDFEMGEDGDLSEPEIKVEDD